MLVFGELMSWVALVPYSVGLIFDWTGLVLVAGAVAALGGIRSLMLAWRVARRLRPANNAKIVASSWDDYAAFLSLMRPSVIKRALQLFR